MKTRVVLLEIEDPSKSSLYGSSGLMINDNYVLTTANILFPLLGEKDIQSMFMDHQPGVLHPAKNLIPPTIADKLKTLRVTYHQNRNSRANLVAMFVSKILQISIKESLTNWAVDLPNNSSDLSRVLSLFFIFSLSGEFNEINLTQELNQWWDLIKFESLGVTDELLIKSVPFGNRTMLDFCSRGIVSNIVGQDSSLVFSDCPTTPGSEGSPVYSKSGTSPVAMVISSLCWWRGDWTGITMMANMRSILPELLKLNSFPVTCVGDELLAGIRWCVLKIYSGASWGSAVVVDVDEGILVTNSHVIDPSKGVEVNWCGHSFECEILHRTPDNEVFDLAILKCDPSALKRLGLRSAKASSNPINFGEEVYAVGFPFFSRNVTAGPTVSRGCVHQSHKSMIKTSCCVNAGMSGGGVFNSRGEVVGIIVCNTRTEEGGLVFPRVNMAIPYGFIVENVEEFAGKKDLNVLRKLHTLDYDYVLHWKNISPKL